jgi:uncharacterized protein (TIGR03118 family)
VGTVGLICVISLRGVLMYDFFMKRLRTSYSRESKGQRHGKVSAVQHVRPCLESLEDRLVPSTAYVQTNLVSNIPGLAALTDPNLKNPWGVAESTTNPFWVSDQGTNVSTLYTATSSDFSKFPLTVAIPTTANGPQGPTGQVYNNTLSFGLANGNPALFIFADLNGTISAWNDGTTATTKVTTPGAVYTGLAIGSNSQGNFLYAVDNKTGTINVFDGSFKPVTLGKGGFGTFTDPNLPAGLAPFNVQNINGQLYVAYAPVGHPAQTAATPGEGAVAVFDTSGNFIRQLTAGGPLASPWGLALAPSSFGQFGGDLLVGNFAYNFSEINAFDPATGQFLGTLTDANGKPFLNPGLWTLTFGSGGIGGDPNTLYFSAGINSERDGLFGEIQAVPSPPPSPPQLPTFPAPQTPFAQLAETIFTSINQQISATFQARDAALLSIESNLSAMNPQLSASFQSLIANLQAQEAGFLGMLKAEETLIINALNQLPNGQPQAGNTGSQVSPPAGGGGGFIY